jgi:uncharacterized protein
MKPIRTIGALVAASALALPATAAAHVTVQPKTIPAGGFTRLDVRVPTERDDASTTKVQLKLPDGFAEASFEPTPGWTVKVDKTKLATPIKTDDGEVTEQVSTITWTGHGKQGQIPPGAFQDFGLSVQVPGKAGDTLTFKALQTYSNGEVVRWIGPEGSDTPAPTVDVTSATPTAAPAQAPAQQAPADDSGSSNTLAIIALILGALGLLAGGVALMTRPRSGVTRESARPRPPASQHGT